MEGKTRKRDKRKMTSQSERTRYWVTQKLPQMYTDNNATFPIRIRKITVHICGNFWVTQYMTNVHSNPDISESERIDFKSQLRKTASSSTEKSKSKPDPEPEAKSNPDPSSAAKQYPSQNLLK